MPHYFDAHSAKGGKTIPIVFTARGREFHAHGSSDVFSKDSLDTGTRVLVEHMIVQSKQRVLDLGCGWGPVGLVVKSTWPDVELVMSDINPKAVSLSKKNLSSDEVVFVVSDGFEHIEGAFDIILLNPPYAAGRQVCYRLIDESFEHLQTHGKLHVVARHQKGGAMLLKHMEELFSTCETIAKKGGFRVYVGTK